MTPTRESVAGNVERVACGSRRGARRSARLAGAHGDSGKLVRHLDSGRRTGQRGPEHCDRHRDLPARRECVRVCRRVLPAGPRPLQGNARPAPVQVASGRLGAGVQDGVEGR